MARGDDFENRKVNGFKGNLKTSSSPIINVKIKDADGTPAYKCKFRVSDRASSIQFLRMIQDKFGFDYFTLKPEYIKTVVSEEQRAIDEEKKHLDDWREKTKGLRDDENFTEKMRKAFTV